MGSSLTSHLSSNPRPLKFHSSTRHLRSPVTMQLTNLIVLLAAVPALGQNLGSGAASGASSVLSSAISGAGSATSTDSAVSSSASSAGASAASSASSSIASITSAASNSAAAASASAQSVQESVANSFSSAESAFSASLSSLSSAAANNATGAASSLASFFGHCLRYQWCFKCYQFCCLKCIFCCCFGSWKRGCRSANRIDWSCWCCSVGSCCSVVRGGWFGSQSSPNLYSRKRCLLPKAHGMGVLVHSRVMRMCVAIKSKH